jgi:4-hydroxy-2-oxoheptanedioate aldolase
MTVRISTLDEDLRAGKRVYGTLIVSTSPKWITALEGMNLDFVFIDTEHTLIDRTTLAWMCKAYSRSGTPAIVRIPSRDPNEATKVIDAGALGLIAPYIETPDQVKLLVGATKLRPLKGQRLTEALDNPDTVQPILIDYLNSYNQGNVLIVNIESMPALDNLDEILSVDGLDGILIGPHDLSISLNIPEQYHNPTFDQVVRDIIAKARSRNVGVGIHFSGDIELEIEWLKAGANLVVHSGDVNLFRRQLTQDLHKIREALGEAGNFPQSNQQIVI